jgi:SAM-dependent MidA family methyltransferase
MRSRFSRAPIESASALRQEIEREVRGRGTIPFSRYMELCLYHPALGYYAANAEQFGKAGDFYTSSDIHAVFGRLLARQFDEIWRALGRPAQIEILELGPGRGLFARDVLDWAKKKFPGFFSALTYTLQERSPALREKLQVNLRESIAAGKANISQPDILQPDGADEESGLFRATLRRSLSGAAPLVVFANEFFDALPVEILSTDGKLHLAIVDNRLSEVWLAPSAEEMEFLDRYSVHPKAGERIEVPLLGQEWIKTIAAVMQQGLTLIVDYGYTRKEQLAGRHRGTLMAYRRHSASSDAYQAPGEQDLTAHVNFTALIAAAEPSGMRCERLVTQSQFLLGIGEGNQFTDVFEDYRVPQERAKAALQLKHLVTPEGMGESFRVLIASKGVQPENVTDLSGLGFGADPSTR